MSRTDISGGRRGRLEVRMRMRMKSWIFKIKIFIQTVVVHTF